MAIIANPDELDDMNEKELHREFKVSQNRSQRFLGWVEDQSELDIEPTNEQKGVLAILLTLEITAMKDEGISIEEIMVLANRIATLMCAAFVYGQYETRGIEIPRAFKREI